TLTAADGMDDPQNVAVDSNGNILVADTYNDRILKYATLIPPDTTPPTVTLTTPQVDQLVSNSGPVTLSGTATDNVGVTSVTYEIQDSDNPAHCTSQTSILLNVSYLQPNGTWAC